MKIPIDKDRLIHIGFDIGLVLKTLLAFVEICCGIALIFFPPDRLNDLIAFIARGELLEDPKDFVMNYLIRLGHSYGISTWRFSIYYLLSHGIVKLSVLVLLWKKRLWAYPLSVIVLICFIAYQLFRLSTSFALSLLLLTILDGMMIVLTILEYKRIKKEQKL